MAVGDCNALGQPSSYPAAKQDDDEDDDQDQPETAAGTITPIPAMRPSRKGADEDQDQQD
jgi:hypothetical protein